MTHALALRRFAVFAIVAGGIFLAGKARGHDVYREFYDSGVVGVGRWCCSGNLEGTAGDCAPAEYTMNPDGSAWMRSRQFPTKHILVPRNRILWMSIPNSNKELERRAAAFEAHLCIRPRQPGQETPDDPNPEFSIICAAVSPGGV
jgi:hypothetical protein